MSGSRCDGRCWPGLLGVVALAAMAAVLTVTTAQAQPGTTERVSLSSSGGEASDTSYEATISADGRFVAFASYASDLVPDDTNGERDVFVRDRLLGTTERISVSSTGEEAHGDTRGPAISADGRFVAFYSDASDLVPDDTNGWTDVFVRDRLLGTTELASLSSLGEQGSRASGSPGINGDGRFVVFESDAPDLVPGDTNGCLDVLVRDRRFGTTELVSLSTSGEQANAESRSSSISADGSYVAFRSAASNLVPDDTNGYRDVFVRDRQLGTTERVSLSSSGEQGNSDSADFGVSISADGQFVAFDSCASNLVPDDTNGYRDVFVRDRQLGTTALVSLSYWGDQGNSDSRNPSISADVRYVAFESWASNLVAGDTNEAQEVFVRDRQLGTTERISLSSSGEQADYWSREPAVSADGRFVGFSSYATNLVAGDTNECEDVFVREREATYYGVSGTVTFQDLDAAATPPASVQVRVTWNGWLFGSYEAALAPDGSYSLWLPAGSLTLSIKHTHWLRQTVPADNSGGPVTEVDFSLVNGDCYDDNSVDLLDLTQVLVHFGGADPMADVNENGLVGLPDLNVILINFGKLGDE
jgi:Tol biopolymer transport system component